MKMNNRFIYGILSLILAAIVAFIAIPAVTSKTSHTTQIVRMKSDVSRGSIVTSGDVELVEVGGYNLPDGLAKEISDVTGTYATTNLYTGDYLLPTKLSKDPLSSDLSLRRSICAFLLSDRCIRKFFLGRIYQETVREILFGIGKLIFYKLQSI
jgi:pilus assembly protein CpaB